MKTRYQIFLSALLGGLSELAYLVTSHILDNYMDKRIANFIGLVVDMVLDFILQSWIFLQPKTIQDYFTRNTMIKFLICSIFINLGRQAFFVFAIEIPSVHKYINYDRDYTLLDANDIDKTSRFHFKQSCWKFFTDRVMHVRYLISAIFFFFVEFPTRKFIVFK
tara:strand:+ start:242 stop:733 length:492 start_codon:yes stop_codon:yes gene_type:complete